MSDSYQLSSGLNDDELHYFQSGGDVNENLAKGLPPEPPAPAPVAEPEKTASPAPAPDADPGDDPVVPGEDLPRRISRNKFVAEQNARRDLERQLNERQVSQARLEERLNLLTQALTPPEEKPAVKTRPDPNQDIFAYIQWQEDQLNEVANKVREYEQQIATGQAELNEQNRYISSMNSYAASQPHFVEAYGFLLKNRAAELMAPRYPQATYEQLMSAQIPEDIGELIRQEERDLYKNAFQNERNPAAEIFRMAQLRGWRPTNAAPAANGAANPPAAAPSQQQRPGTPMGAAPPAAAPPATQGAPTATAMVEAIKRGQPAAQSLSNVSGSAAMTELTPEALANMSDEQFARLYNQMVNSGDTDKLRSLFGN